ncbi:MAG: hypothetical protein JWM28_3839 [Chitinophagaceae bacterium]|nr:hypothetical protein [Chitinophagaceae bacterium]
MAAFKYGEITEKITGAAIRGYNISGNYPEVYTLEAGMLIKFGSKRVEYHHFTNTKYDPSVVHQPFPSIHLINPSSDQ